MAFTDKEMRERFERGSLNYKGYTIQAKRDYSDFIAYDQGFFLRDGFVIVKNGCNAMPGACWFTNIQSAKEAIDILGVVGEKNFWDTYYRIKEAKQKAVQAILDEVKVLS